MQGVDDTVDMVVVSTIVDELDADAHNMRHIYPYRALVAQGVLPAGLDHSVHRPRALTVHLIAVGRHGIGQKAV